MEKIVKDNQNENPVRDRIHQVMTVKETSEYLRLGVSTFYKLANPGKLPARKIGGSWRFSRRALEDWLGEPSHSYRNLKE